MSYARIRAALRKCCGCHDEEENQSALQAEPVEQQSKLALTFEQWQGCLASLHGNWNVNLEQKLAKLNAKLNDYLPRYYNTKSRIWLTLASMQPDLRLLDATTEVNNFDKLMSMPEWHAPHYVVTATLENYYNAAVFANCLVYFANSVAELKTLHHDTVLKFKQSLAQAPSKWQHFTVPPIFLIVTDPKSELRNKEVLSTLPVPILHSICVNPCLDIMSPSRFSARSIVDPLFWQSLIKYTITPCYEKLAVAAGLIDAVRLPLENKVATRSLDQCIFINHLDAYDDHEHSADSSDSDEEEVELQIQLSSLQAKQLAEQVLTMPASAPIELLLTSTITSTNTNTTTNTETVSAAENIDAANKQTVTFKP